MSLLICQVYFCVFFSQFELLENMEEKGDNIVRGVLIVRAEEVLSKCKMSVLIYMIFCRLLCCVLWVFS